jgi:hypothetical protein
MIHPEVAGLGLSIAAGAIKLGRRVDAILAEEASLRADLPLSFPRHQRQPTMRQLRGRLRELLRSTEGERPDPLADRRAQLAAVAKDGDRSALVQTLAAEGLDQFDLGTFDPDAEFREALRLRNELWSLDDEDQRRLTWFVTAGVDYRSSSLAFRLGVTVFDVFAEFAQWEVGRLVRNPRARALVEGILRRFAAADLAALDGSRALLQQLLRSSVEGLLDARSEIAEPQGAIGFALEVLGQARDADADDDFLLGLVRGEGFGLLVATAAEEGAKRLGGEQASPLESVLGSVLATAAPRARQSPDFASFLNEHWGAVGAAGLRAVADQGPRILGSETEIASRAFGIALEAVATQLESGVAPGGATLSQILEALLAAVADEPELLLGDEAEEFARQLVTGYAGLLAQGLDLGFDHKFLEGLYRRGLEALKLHPELVGEDLALLPRLLRSVLGRLAEHPTHGLEALADSALAGVLDAIADAPWLAGGGFDAVVGSLARSLADRIAERTLTRLEAADLIETAIEVLAAHPELFVEYEARLAERTVDALVRAVAGDPARLLGGVVFVDATRRILRVVGTRGLDRLEDLGLDAFSTQLETLVSATLARAQQELGRRIDRLALPAALAGVVDAWAAGTEWSLDPDDPDFASWFAMLADSIVSAEAQLR